MADCKITAQSTESLTTEEDSGLVADACDVLPDENTLAFDDNFLCDLTSFEDDKTCYEEFHCEPQNISKELVDEGAVEDIEDDQSILENREKTVVIKKTEEPLQSSTDIFSGKLVAFNREQARQWRRKRLLSSQIKHGNVSETSNKLLYGKDKLKPLLPLPMTLKPMKEKKTMKDDTEAERKLLNPLLGGEKIRHPKGPMPMKLRSLPESFWKEPTTINTSSLARNNYTVLPPLFSSENQSTDEVMNVRPITPPDQKGKSPSDSPRHKKKWVIKGEPDAELLFSLFDHLEEKVDERLIVKRGRPKKNLSEKPPPPPPRDVNDDPCIVDNLAEKLFPELSLSQRAKEKVHGSSYAIIKIGKGKGSVEFPAIQVEQNYPEILNELITHM